MRLHTLSVVSSLFVAGASALPAQHPTDVVHWTAKAHHVSSTAEIVTLEGSIQEGWHVYAPSQQPGGPTPMTIKLVDGQGFSLNGKVVEGPTTKKHDSQFDMETVFFTKEARLSVPLKTTSEAAGKKPILGVRFQVCNESMCLPPATVPVEVKGP